MSRVFLVSFGACLALAGAVPSPPLLGPVMTAPFNQTIRIFGFEFDNYVQARGGARDLFAGA